jgi:hypothetical protein
MAKRREPGQKEYNPLDDARGRLPIETDLIRAVTSPVPAAAPPVIDPPAQAPPIAPAAAASAPPPPVTPIYEERPEPPRHAPRKFTLEKLTAYNKFLTTPTEKLELDRLAARVSGALGVSVKSSQLIRACLVLLLRAENQIIRRAEGYPPFKRPSNTEAVALAEFDQLLAEILSHAFRDAGALKSRQ